MGRVIISALESFQALASPRTSVLLWFEFYRGLHSLSLGFPPLSLMGPALQTANGRRGDVGRSLRWTIIITAGSVYGALSPHSQWVIDMQYSAERNIRNTHSLAPPPTELEPSS
jgi:hypothetical protein